MRVVCINDLSFIVDILVNYHVVISNFCYLVAKSFQNRNTLHAYLCIKWIFIVNRILTCQRIKILLLWCAAVCCRILTQSLSLYLLMPSTRLVLYSLVLYFVSTTAPSPLFSCILFSKYFKSTNLLFSSVVFSRYSSTNLLLCYIQ